MVWGEATATANTMLQEHTYYTSQGTAWAFREEARARLCRTLWVLVKALDFIPYVVRR